MKFYYGLESVEHGSSIITEVVNGLGGGENARKLMMGTACAESQFGTYPDDNPEKLGVGWMQHDEINLKDIKQEGEQKHFDIVKRLWGYDIPSIELSDLAYDPLLSAICCRLSYKRIPEVIPSSLFDQAGYWKLHYNRSGKGNESHYIKSAGGLFPCGF